MSNDVTGATPRLRSRHTLRALTGFATLALCASMFGAAGCNQTQIPSRGPAEQAVAMPAPAAAPAPVAVPETFNVADLAERVKPTVVNITTTHEVAMEGRSPQGDSPFDYFFGPRAPGSPGFGLPWQQGQPQARPLPMKQTALGTGFIIDSAGYIVTNEHVIHDADEVRVRLSDDRELEADVVGRDPKQDLALLKIKGSVSLPAAPLGASDTLRVGEYVLAVGNPFGLGHTVTMGIVSAKARSIGAGPYDDFIQTDASINPGNSGGPLFNWRGEVVGINTAIRANANSIGFAIPIDALKDVLPQLRDKGYVERGKLGLAFQPVTQDLAKALSLDTPKGALVADVEPGSAAARAGIEAGDVIVGIDGAAIAHAEELPRNVARHAPGTDISVSLLRGKEAREVKATLDALKDDEASTPPPGRSAGPERGQSDDKLGIQVSDAREGGVRVDGVLPGSKATELQRGDVIVALNGKPVADIAELKAEMQKAEPGSMALLKLSRRSATRFAAVPVPGK